MICFTTTPQLESILKEKKIEPCDYRPAYNGESVGLDLYNAGPDITITPTVDDRDPYAPPKVLPVVLIPTGVKLALPVNTVGLLQERGSIVKTPLKLRAGVVDPGYTGEIFVNLVCFADIRYQIKSGEKLPVQLIVMPVITDYHWVNNDAYSNITSNSARAAGKIGSSD